MKAKNTQSSKKVSLKVSAEMAEFVEMLSDEAFEIPKEIANAITDVTHIIMLHRDEMSAVYHGKINKALLALTELRDSMIKLGA